MMENFEDFCASIDGELIYNISINCPCGNEIEDESMWLYDDDKGVICKECKRVFKLSYKMCCEVKENV